MVNLHGEREGVHDDDEEDDVLEYLGCHQPPNLCSAAL